MGTKVRGDIYSMYVGVRTKGRGDMEERTHIGKAPVSSNF